MKEEKQRLYLKVPTYDELWFRKEMLLDPYTMEFNKGYELDIPNYNYENGTIDFDETMWTSWYNDWIEGKDNFYAYVVRTVDDKFIGEVSFKNKNNKGYETNILLHSTARGFHYSLDALNLLSKEAFEKRNIISLSDELPEYLFDRIKIFENAGYKKMLQEPVKQQIKRFGVSLPMVKVEFTKVDYLKTQGKGVFSSKITSLFNRKDA